MVLPSKGAKRPSAPERPGVDSFEKKAPMPARNDGRGRGQKDCKNGQEDHSVSFQARPAEPAEHLTVDVDRQLQMHMPWAARAGLLYASHLLNQKSSKAEEFQSWPASTVCKSTVSSRTRWCAVPTSRERWL